MKSVFRFDPFLVARGTEEFWIPAVLAAVGTAGGAVNQMNANQRANNAESQSIADQQQFRQQANDQVKNLTNQIATNNPQQIANKETSDFVNTLRKNQAGSAAGGPTGTNQNTFGQPVSALPPASGASSRYNTDTAASQKEVQQYGTTEAGQMSAIDSAVRQRQNEGLALNTLGTNLNTLGAESYTKNFVDQLRSQAAGQANPWVGLFSNMLQKGASAYAMGAGGKTPPTNLTSQYSGGYQPTAGTGVDFVSG